MFNVFENGERVGYITRRASGWFQFVASKSYFATGLAGEMDETVGDTAQEVAQKLENAGLEVKEE